MCVTTRATPWGLSGSIVVASPNGAKRRGARGAAVTPFQGCGGVGRLAYEGCALGYRVTPLRG